MLSEELTSPEVWGAGRVIEGERGKTIDVPEGAGLFILDCIDCTINAPDKSTSVTIERCNGTSVFMGSVEASVVIKHCEGVEVILLRCHTITVESSKKMTLTCKCQSAAELEDQKEQSPSPEQQTSTDKVKTAEDEASAIHLFTICSEDVSISFEGLLKDDGSTVTYRVPKDSRDDESGAGPRSVSRITFDLAESGKGVGGVCTTVKCDRNGTPLEEIEVAAAGVAWLSDHVVTEAKEVSGAAGFSAEGKGEMPEMPTLASHERDSSVAAETESVADLLDVVELLDMEKEPSASGTEGESLGEKKASSASMLRLASFGSMGASSMVAEAGSVGEVVELTDMLDSEVGLSAVVELSGEAEPDTAATAGKAGGESKSSKVPESSG